MNDRIIALVNNHKQEIIALKDFQINFPGPEVIYGEVFDIEVSSKDNFVETYVISAKFRDGVTTTYVDSLAYNPIYYSRVEAGE